MLRLKTENKLYKLQSYLVYFWGKVELKARDSPGPLAFFRKIHNFTWKLNIEELESAEKFTLKSN